MYDSIWCLRVGVDRSDRVSHARMDPSLGRAVKLEGPEHLHTYEVVAK